MIKLLAFSLILLQFIQTFKQHQQKDRPIIGVVTQPTRNTLAIRKRKGLPIDDLIGKKYTIASSVVQFIEQSGGRVYPIKHDSDYQDIDEILEKKVNGVMLPGGGHFLLIDNDTEFEDYQKTVNYIINQVKSLNDRGIIFPIFGVCQGLQNLIINEACIEGQKCQVISDTAAKELYTSELEIIQNKNNILNFDKYEIFEATTKFIEEQSANIFHHSKMVEVQTFEKTPQLVENFNIIAKNKTPNGEYIISLLESKKYPFFGAQFHPEKLPFEFASILSQFHHSKEAIQFSRYLSDKFIEESKKNFHARRINLDELLEYQNWEYIHLVASEFDRLYLSG